MASDHLLLDSDHAKTQSDIALVSTFASDAESAIVVLSTKMASDHLLLDSDHAKTQSDVALTYTAIGGAAIAELAQAAPSATPSLGNAVMMLYMMARNKAVTQTSGTDALEFYNDAGTKVFIKLLTDDGDDYTEAEMTTGA